MTREEFWGAVIAEGIHASAFKLDEAGDDCYVLSRNNSDWSVYYSERGIEIQKRQFSSESLALDYLLAMLRKDPSARSAS